MFVGASSLEVLPSLLIQNLQWPNLRKILRQTRDNLKMCCYKLRKLIYDFRNLSHDLRMILRHDL